MWDVSEPNHDREASSIVCAVSSFSSFLIDALETIEKSEDHRDRKQNESYQGLGAGGNEELVKAYMLSVWEFGNFPRNNLFHEST